MEIIPLVSFSKICGPVCSTQTFEVLVYSGVARWR
jgi:hypothetical protein